MTSIDLKLKLPESLAREAEAAGLLSSRGVARLLREEMRRAAFRQIAEGVERIRKAGLPELSLVDSQREVDKLRTGE
jgi:hypothetical protein